MNCDLNVLWVEDQENWYRLEKNHLAQQIEPYALELKSVYCRGDEKHLNEELPDESGEHSNRKAQYDLILMDFQLGREDLNGAQLIESIRARNILTDVLFYSSNYQEMIEQAMSGNKPLDGVYFAERKREEFEPKLESVVQKIIRRSESIINLRGLVLENTTTFEESFKQIMNDCWYLLEDSSADELNKIALRALEHNEVRVKKDIHDCSNSDKSFFICANQSYCLDTSQRVQIIFDKIVPMLEKTYGLQLSTPAEESSKLYLTQINTVRNKLGHVKEGNSIKLYGKTIPVNSALHARMRESIRAFDQQLTELIEFISSARSENSI